MGINPANLYKFAGFCIFMVNKYGVRCRGDGVVDNNVASKGQQPRPLDNPKILRNA